MKTIDFENYRKILCTVDPLEHGGKVMKIVGLTIESNGPVSKIGDVCRVYSYRSDRFIEAEVIGFKDQRVLLMPFGKVEGIGLGSYVISTNRSFEVPVGKNFIGRVVDALGKPIDNMGTHRAGALLSGGKRTAKSICKKQNKRNTPNGNQSDRRSPHDRQRTENGHFLRKRSRQEHPYGNDRAQYCGRH